MLRPRHALATGLAQQPLDDHLDTPRTRPHRTGGGGSGPPRRRCRRRASSGSRMRARSRSRCRARSGRSTRMSFAARRTLSMSRSNGNSGVWTPTTTSPCSAYRSLPGPDVRQGAQPVDAGVGPEVDENDLAPHVRGGEWRRVEPPGRAVEAGQVPLDGKRAGTTEAAEQAQVCTGTTHAVPPITRRLRSAAT